MADTSPSSESDVDDTSTSPVPEKHPSSKKKRETHKDDDFTSGSGLDSPEVGDSNKGRKSQSAHVEETTQTISKSSGGHVIQQSGTSSPSSNKGIR